MDQCLNVNPLIMHSLCYKTCASAKTMNTGALSVQSLTRYPFFVAKKTESSFFSELSVHFYLIDSLLF